MQWGIDELVHEGSDYWESMKHAPDVAAMKMRSRSTESSILIENFRTGGYTSLMWIVQQIQFV